jgi:hypothetical protein
LHTALRALPTLRLAPTTLALRQDSTAWESLLASALWSPTHHLRTRGRSRRPTCQRTTPHS